MKNKLIDEIYNYKVLIMESPELFSDGMDDEIINLLNKILKYLEREEK